MISEVVKKFQDQQLLMIDKHRQHRYDILNNNFHTQHIHMTEKEIDQERKNILEIKAAAFDAILHNTYRPASLDSLYGQTRLIVEDAENKIKVIYARTGDRIVKDMYKETLTTTMLNKPLPELTYEEEERDFFKQEDTSDLELYKIKQKIVDIEKLVRTIHNEIIKRFPHTN